jgi:Kef-type K+ transport system membrane component KefB
MPDSPLLLQLVVILCAARVLGLVLRYAGQPAVLGEMAAGLVLGPIVFGVLAPELHGWLFAPGSLGALDALSQVGLVLVMFIVGAELRLPGGLRGELAAATWVGMASVLVPMVLGLGVAALVYADLAPAGVDFWPFALFLAAAMSVTALPVMARILKDRGMTQSAIGRLSLTSATVADVLAWIMLGFVVALAGSGHDWGRFLGLLFGLALFLAGMFWIVRPACAWLLRRHAADGRPGGSVLAALLIGLFACAYGTTLLGAHPVFGAVVFGASLPRDARLLETLVERIEYLAISVLMPIFFALAGLGTTSSAFVGGSLGTLMLVLVAAVAGKVFGGAAGARLAGQPWRGSLAVGALMNARGLMELIVIKVGLDLGVIGPELFTILFVMAIVTTAMSGPLLTAILRSARP